MWPSGYGWVWTSPESCSPVGGPILLAWGPLASGLQASVLELPLPSPPLPSAPAWGLLLSTREPLTPANSLMPPHAWGITCGDPFLLPFCLSFPRQMGWNGYPWRPIPGLQPSVSTDGSMGCVPRSSGSRAVGTWWSHPRWGLSSGWVLWRGAPWRKACLSRVLYLLRELGWSEPTLTTLTVSAMCTYV